MQVCFGISDPLHFSFTTFIEQSVIKVRKPPLGLAVIGDKHTLESTSFFHHHFWVVFFNFIYMLF